MGRMAEDFEREREHQVELEWARIEAAHDALPETLKESHQLIVALQTQVSDLVRQSNAAGPKWVERLYGFGFGIVASLVASAAWQKASSVLPGFQ
jgi:hypothetical protein